MIIHHRNNFEKDVEILCKWCEDVFGPSGCTPNLHSLHHMIRRLIVLKGHPTFEMIVERLVSLMLYVPRFPIFIFFNFLISWVMLLIMLLMLLLMPLFIIMPQMLIVVGVNVVHCANVVVYCGGL